MKKILHTVGASLTGLKSYLLAYGALGLFGIAMLDSALIPIPGGPDAAMILLTAANPGRMLLYASTATVGSVVGCVILYQISKRAGSRALSRFSASKQRRVSELIDRYDVLSILVASVLPPPFPFKLFVISAGVFRVNILRFVVAVSAGRAFRFLLEGYLAVHYGEHAKELLAHYYPYIGVGVAVLIVLIFIALGFRRRGSDDDLNLMEPTEEV